ncbi:MAG: hypothetical protein WCV81_05815 [Microgenomates group bacterium]|jgi:hypothetical protein
MCENKAGISETDPNSNVRIEWLDFNSSVNSGLKALILQRSENGQVMDVLITSEHSSAFNLRNHLLELAILRSLTKDQLYAQIYVQNEQIQSDRKIISIRTEPPLWFSTGNTNFVTNGGVEITQNMIVFLKHKQASELQYNQARLAILNEANILLKDVKRPPFPPIEFGK